MNELDALPSPDLRAAGDDAKRLLELRRKGVSMSRNRNFDLFSDPTMRRCLDLHRRLERLGRFLLFHHSRGDLTVERRVHSGGDVELEMHVPSLAARYTTYLPSDALALLLESEGVSEVLNGNLVREAKTG